MVYKDTTGMTNHHMTGYGCRCKALTGLSVSWATQQHFLRVFTDYLFFRILSWVIKLRWVIKWWWYVASLWSDFFSSPFPPPVTLRPHAGHGFLILEFSWSHTTTHHSRYDFSGRVIGSSQRPLPDNTHNKHPCPRWDSNPRSQQASGRRRTP